MGQDVLNSNRYKNKVLKQNFPLVLLSNFHASFISQNKFKIVPFGIKKPIENQEQKQTDIVFIGNLTSLKNPLYFLKVVEALNNSSLIIKIIGDGPEKQKCIKFLHSKAISNVELLGACSYEKTQEYLSSSKLLIHSSSFESFGMIFIEAMANCVHVLSSSVGIANQHPEIHNLTFDARKDAEKVNELLNKETPLPFIYDVENTVDKYLTFYESFTKNGW